MSSSNTSNTSEPSKVTVELGKGSSGIETARHISEGTVPTNEVLLDTLESAKQSISQSASGQSGEAQTISQDAQRVVDATKTLLVEKNPDEKLQQVVASGRDASVHGAKAAANQSDKVNPRSHAKAFGSEIATAGRELATLITQSSELRGLFLEQIKTFRRLFWNRVQKDPHNQENATNPGGALHSETRGHSVQTAPEEIPAAGFAAAPSHAAVVKQAQADPNFQNITLTQEEKRELINSWREFFTRLGAKPNYGNALNNIFTLVDHLSELRTQAPSAGQDPNVQAAQEHSQNSFSGFKEIIERFMGGRTLDNLFRLLREFYQFSTEHPEVRQFGSDWSNYANETMRNPQLLHDEAHVQTIDNLVDRTVFWMNVPYFREQTRAIGDETKEVFNAIRDDPHLSEMQQAWNQLFRDLATDEQGNLSINKLTTSLPAFKNILAPILIEQFNYIPINRVSGTSPKIDYELSNIVFSARDVLPESFLLDFHTRATVGTKATSTNDKVATHLKLKVSNINLVLNNVDFYYNRKTTPKIEDEGTVNVSVLPPGATIKIVWELAAHEKGSFRVNFVRAVSHIDNLTVDVVKAKHSVLDKIVTKLFGGQIRSNLENAINSGLSNVGNSIADRLNRAVKGQKQPPTNAKVGGQPGQPTFSNANDATPVNHGTTSSTSTPSSNITSPNAPSTTAANAPASANNQPAVTAAAVPPTSTAVPPSNPPANIVQ